MSDVTGGATLTAGEARFEFGRVVGLTMGLIGRNFVMFSVLALIFVGAPQFGILYLQSTAIGAGDVGLLGLITIGALIINVVMTYVLQGALTRASVDDLSGAGVKFGAALGDGLRFFFPLFILGILVSLGVFVGLLILIVPGIILAVRWCIAAPVTVIERDGPTHAMGRSAELTEGCRWAIFGLLVLYLVFAYAVQIVLGLALEATRAGASEAPLLVMDATGYIYGIVTAAVAALVTLVSTVGTAALYFELRRVKEGVGVADLAAVFD